MEPQTLPILVSVVVVVQNAEDGVDQLADAVGNVLERTVSDYEIVIVDNGSTDCTQETLRKLTADDGIANLQIYCLAGRVDDTTARWVGVENSLGDIVVCIDSSSMDAEQLELLIKAAADGYDIVFARRAFAKGRRSIARTTLYKSLGAATRLATGINLDSYSTKLLALSRRVVNYLHQFPEPQIKFRNLPSVAGFKRVVLNIPRQKSQAKDIRLRESFARGIQLVTSSSESPLRIATFLSAFGALATLLYSIYVLLVWALKSDVAPGWVSLSMQQSGMFFLISLVLLILSEYVLEISRKANSGPVYYIADEFTSARLSRKQRLNVEVEGRLTSAASKRLFRL